MLRRIVSLGQQASESDEPMSPTPEDAASTPEIKSPGGLASVFKGLTGSKYSKSPPPPPTRSSPSLVPPVDLPSDHIDVASCNPRGLLPNHMESFDRLRNGTLSERVAAANALSKAIVDYPLNPVLDVWYAAKDLIEPSKPITARQAGWELLTECVKHEVSTDIERKEYFQTISARANPEDFHLQLAALVDLTKHGRDLSGFDYDVLPLLTRWLKGAYKTVTNVRKQQMAALRSTKGPKPKVVKSREDKSLSELFSLIFDVIKFNFKVADDQAAGDLILVLLDICITTHNEDDLKSCISVINAIVTFGSIPSTELAPCVKVLSSIFALVPDLNKESWHALANLCKSHHGQATVQVLLNVLRNHPHDGRDSSRDARGALAALQKLVSKSSGKGYPQIPLALLVDGLANVANARPSGKVCIAVLRMINSLFNDGDRSLNPILIDEDWCLILEVAANCARKALAFVAQDGSSASSRDQASISSGSSKSEASDEAIVGEVRTLAARLEELLTERRSEFVQRQDCIAFFIKVHLTLPDSAVGLVLDYFKEFRCCFPSDYQWQENLTLVVDSFYANRHRSTLIRLRALQTITEVYDMLKLVGDQVDEQAVPDLVRRILSGISEETDTMLLQETVAFMVSVATSADTELFDSIIEALKQVVSNDRLRSPISPVSTESFGPRPVKSTEHPGYFANQSPSNVVTRGYAQIFMRTMDVDVAKACKIFKALVHIARSNLCESDARLTAMKLLFRLRADWANRIFLTPFTESESLAGYLYRTESSLARKLAEDAAQASRQSRSEQAGPPSRPSRGTSFSQGQAPEKVALPVRSASGAKAPPIHKYQQLWAVPDPDALPETPSSTASPVLFSHLEHPTSNPADHPADAEGPAEVEIALDAPPCLSMATWLDAICSLFHNGCDWEVYSFILVHLPAQLSNHAVFQDAIPQIQGIRKLLCEQIRMNSFQEPPNSAGPRRPDVLVCLFHILTMILSYHRHFEKSEEDEIVRTFIQGIADKTAVCCVHALSICCHELPMSTSKSLVNILQRMSQIITRQGVAVHILEFLACLSRLPSLYKNFREDEYRIVFGISFRYLQTARDNRRSSRTGPGGEQPSPSSAEMVHIDAPGQAASSDDLPQYVYALAYHVITFWFLALKLPDRASHVGWIASRLFTDNDGKQIADEQAQVTLDFMQRVAFADADESAEDPLFKEKSGGEVVERRWVVGNSIVSIQQGSEAGWAQIVKRQPSGTSYFTVRENFRPRPPHQARNPLENPRDSGHHFSGISALPSHLLVQLLSPIPQTYDAPLRPIPLPDDDAVDRAIRAFDRNSIVDGHKVGVIYIGEKQTSETEILANVSGSSDYVDFLDGLGTLTKLKGATFNTQGLDREYDTDGQYTFCWRDRVTEIVFHVTTQMPTNREHDPQCVNKKRHIGNDFVNIIFNDSGLPFRFDTFPSDFNYVYIVITPESRASFVASREQKLQPEQPQQADLRSLSFYKVQVLSKPGFPEISPAAETKMLSLKALPDFVRLLAVNASVFSMVWANRKGADNVSSWRNRLREINRMRERYGPKVAPSPSPPPTSLVGGGSGGVGAPSGPQHQQQPPQVHQPDGSRPASSVRDSFSSFRRSSVATLFTTASEQTSHRSSVLSTATTDNTEVLAANGTDSLIDSLDFSKWA